MRILLDSHLLVWLVGASDRLPPEAREIIENVDNDIFFSSASIWELSIKYSSGKIGLELPPRMLHRVLIESDFKELAVTASHALEVDMLQPIHKDPFDRILIAQAMWEGMLLLTSDETIAQYNAPIRLVR
ncbi:type II toxin-antitoxin system VapC family toxin [Neorhizobium sp. CSC1952]|uniref:type II toxin-antitoxin system VapC family toxin n=1 Tax=Neorhizobium sp. CSC1952 TaxID=2978974 RepID=UPI0025A5A39D|nr:type II toxin-antitoxin system VapC family toxin [Rhizobium sp. CSC1952]WJR68337.1 type II toxin-antitoxin system VapC family toxin [Rhizobium sp. CSC1952]